MNIVILILETEDGCRTIIEAEAAPGVKYEKEIELTNGDVFKFKYRG